MLKIFGKFFLQSVAQIVFTSVVTIGLLIFLLRYLPDYASFGELGEMALEISKPISGAEENAYTNKNNFIQNNFHFWEQAFTGEFGFSRVHQDQTVGNLIKKSSLVTFFLILTSFAFTSILGGILGLISGYRYGHSLERAIQFFGNLLTAMPSFLLAPILIFIFSIRWPIFPSALWSGPASLVLPVLTLSLRPTFYLARLFSLQIHETFQTDFIKVAQSKGVGFWGLWFSHVIPNSFSAFIIATGNLLGQFVSGLFIVEALFALPGLGHLFIQSLAERDYPLFLALVLVFSLILQLGHRISEFIVLWFSPAHQESRFE